MDEVEGLDRADAPTAAKSGRKKLAIIAAAVAVILGGGGSGAYFMLGRDEHVEAAAEDAVYVDLEPMLINIRSADGQKHFLKVHLTLATTPEAKEKIEAKMPAVIDAMQGFIRELRPEDLSGTSGMFRLKEELLVRAERSVGAGQVSDVLIQEMVQQ